MSGFSYSGKEHVLELQPVSPKASELSLAFKLEGTPAAGEFKVAIELAEIQASVNEWWPGIRRDVLPVRFDVEHVVLGLTKSQIEMRALWRLDQNIRGVGFGLLPPVGPKIGEDGSVVSGSGGFYNFAPETSRRPWYAQLLDNDNRRKVGLEQIRFTTDSVSGA